jgi:hypothetical protein
MRPGFRQDDEMEEYPIRILEELSMGTAFWLRRFAWIYTIAFAVIGASQYLLRGRTPADAATQAAIWGGIAAVVFTAGRIRQSRRGEHCALCRDTPEMQ